MGEVKLRFLQKRYLVGRRAGKEEQGARRKEEENPQVSGKAEVVVGFY